jgi:hypothetical protein
MIFLLQMAMSQGITGVFWSIFGHGMSSIDIFGQDSPPVAIASSPTAPSAPSGPALGVRSHRTRSSENSRMLLDASFSQVFFPFVWCLFGDFHKDGIRWVLQKWIFVTQGWKRFCLSPALLRDLAVIGFKEC